MIPIDLHPAVELAFEVWGWLLAIAFVLWCIVNLDKAITNGNRSIKAAEYIPGGKQHVSTGSEEEEKEKAWWQANA